MILSPKLSETLAFFLYDLVEILLLLLVITFIMSAINTLIPVEKIRNFLSGKKLYGLEYLFAALFGTITPFCSCSSVPLFIGFMRGGIPLGVTFAFLISSPLVDSVVIAMLLGLFGLKATLVYVVTGIIISMIAGFAIGKMGMEKHIAEWARGSQEKVAGDISLKMNKAFFLKNVSKEAFGIMRKVLPYVIGGVALGALIHGYVPAGFFEENVGKESFWSVPLAVILGVPLYANAAGMLPIAHALFVKGIPLGTVLAFMMATTALSLPEALLLKKAMKWQLLATFFGIVAIAIILSGYLFNLVL